MNPAHLVESPAATASAALLRTALLAGPSRFSREAGVVATVRVADDRARRAAEQWPREARALAEALGWPAGTYVVRQSHGQAQLFLSAPASGFGTAHAVARHAWRRADAVRARVDGDPVVVEDALPALRQQFAEEYRQAGPLQAMIEAAQRHGVTWQLADGCLTVGSGSFGSTWGRYEVPALWHVDWSRRLEVPTVLTVGEPLARDIGSLVTMVARVAGIGAAFGSSEAEAQSLVRDREVDAIVVKLSPAQLVEQALPVRRADVVVIASAVPADLETLEAIAAAAGPHGRLVLNADVPVLHTLAAAVSVPVVWYSEAADSPMVHAGVTAWGDGAAIVAGHLMVAHDDVWCDAGRVDRLPTGLAPVAALAAALAALCAGIPLDRVTAALPL